MVHCTFVEASATRNGHGSHLLHKVPQIFVETHLKNIEQDLYLLGKLPQTPSETHLGSTVLDLDLECKASKTFDISLYHFGLSFQEKHPLEHFVTLLAKIGPG